MSASLNRRIFSAAAIVGALTLGGKIVAMAKEMYVASWFGTGDALDAFLMAFLLPSYAINVIAGSIDSALIPVFVEVREKEGHAAAQRLFSGTLVFSLALLTVSTLLLAALAPVLLPLVCAGFSPEKLALTQRLFYLLLPSILINGVMMNCGAAINAGERFALVALAPALVSLAMIGALAVAGTQWGVRALTVGMLAGFLGQAALLGWALRQRGFHLAPRWHGLEPGLRRVIGQYAPAIAASAVMCSTQVVDQTMAGLLPAGSVSALNYGNKFVALLLGIGTMALGTAVLPYFSRLAAAADWAGLRHTLKTYTALIVGVTVPLVAAAVLLASPLVALLFQRGKFTPADTAVVAGVQTMYVLQVPFYTLTILFVRMISSLQANQVLMWGTIISFALNISLDYLLMQFMGVAGIALSTSIVYAVLSVFLGLVLWARLRRLSS